MGHLNFCIFDLINYICLFIMIFSQYFIFCHLILGYSVSLLSFHV